MPLNNVTPIKKTTAQLTVEMSNTMFRLYTWWDPKILAIKNRGIQLKEYLYKGFQGSIWQFPDGSRVFLADARQFYTVVN